MKSLWIFSIILSWNTILHFLQVFGIFPDSFCKWSAVPACFLRALKSAKLCSLHTLQWIPVLFALFVVLFEFYPPITNIGFFLVFSKSIFSPFSFYRNEIQRQHNMCKWLITDKFKILKYIFSSLPQINNGSLQILPGN